MGWVALGVAGWGFGNPCGLRADEYGVAGDDPLEMGPLVVYGREQSLVGAVDSAASGLVGAPELAERPLLRRGELLEVVPGLIVTQHSGDGKANQYFLRGFNLDHGTDFATSVDAVPVNLPSNAHGQGYTDLNFLIPEVVGSISYEKGTYLAMNGDFSAAGAAQIHLVDTLTQPVAKIEAGSFGFARAVVADSWSTSGGAAVVAAEFGHYDGPWVTGEDANHETFYARRSWNAAGSRFSLTATAYQSQWTSTDQVPLRAITEGLIPVYGAIDPSDGGATARASLAFDWSRGSAQAESRLNLFALYYRLDLFSDFTFRLSDPVNGDQFNQRDRRGVFGGSGSQTWSGHVGGSKVTATLGFEGRADTIALGLLNTRERKTLAAVDLSSVHEYEGAGYADVKLEPLSCMRLDAGLRVDGLDCLVDDSVAGNSGERSAAILSPKCEAAFGPWNRTEVYVDAGDGFHSNDARGVVQHTDPMTGGASDPVTPLVRAEGVEMGVRTSAIEGLTSTVSLWALDLASELTFDGDSGQTSPNGPSRRSGVEFANFYHPTRWLAFDGDVSFTRARYRTPNDSGFGAGDYIPNAVASVVSAGVFVHSPHGLFASLRVRYFGRQPLVETGASWEPSSTTWNARVGWRGKKWAVGADLLNLLDRHNDDIAYYYVSRLPGEPLQGVAGVHIHPAEPFMVRVSLQRRL